VERAGGVASKPQKCRRRRDRYAKGVEEERSGEGVSPFAAD